MESLEASWRRGLDLRALQEVVQSLGRALQTADDVGTALPAEGAEVLRLEHPRPEADDAWRSEMRRLTALLQSEIDRISVEADLGAPPNQQHGANRPPGPEPPRFRLPSPRTSLIASARAVVTPHTSSGGADFGCGGGLGSMFSQTSSIYGRGGGGLDAASSRLLPAPLGAAAATWDPQAVALNAAVQQGSVRGAPLVRQYKGDLLLG